MSRKILNDLLQKVLSTPQRSSDQAANRGTGGRNESINSDNDEMNFAFQRERDAEMYEEPTPMIDLSTSPDVQEQMQTRGTTLGTSSFGPSRRVASNLLFINTEEVEDDLGPFPSSNNLSSGTSNRSGTSTRTDLLTARSSGSTENSVNWSNINNINGSNRFSVFEIPSDSKSFNNLCKKKINNGTTMCTKFNCSVKHRGGEAANIRKGDILVQKAVDVVFLEPSTHTSNITMEVLIQWLSTKKRLEDWSTLFAVANATSHSEVLSPDDIQQGTAFSSLARNHKSPGVLNARRFEKTSDTFTSLLNSIPKQGQFESSLGNRKRTMSEDELEGDLIGGTSTRRKLSDELSLDSVKGATLKEAVDHLYKLLTFLTEKLDDKDVAITEEVQFLFARIEGVQTDLGTRSTSRSDKLEVPTLWGSIAVLAGTIDEMQREYQGPPLTKELKQALFKEIDRIELDAAKTVNLIIVDLETRVAGILARNNTNSNDREAELKQLTNELKHLQDIQTRSQLSSEEILLKLAEGAAILKDEIGFLRQQTRSHNVNASNSPLSNNCIKYVQIDMYESKMSILESDINLLRSKLSKVVSDSEGDAIKSFGLGFRDRRASDLWLENNLAEGDLGLIVDVHLVFEQLFFMTSENEGSLKMLHAISKLELTNMTQGLCISSFETRIPKMLSKSSSMPIVGKARGGGISYFDRVETFDVWDEASCGIKVLIIDNLKIFGNSHQDQINDSTADDSRGRAIATQALDASVLWIHQFINYIDETYKGLMRQSTFTPEKAWELTTQLGRRIFYEVSMPRTGISSTLNIKNTEKLNKLCFWPMLRCHDVMKSFKDASYKDHPTISGEYVKFLTSNSESEVTERLLTKITALKDENVSTMKLAKTASATASSAMNVADEMKKKIQELERRLTRQEGNKKG